MWTPRCDEERVLTDDRRAFAKIGGQGRCADARCVDSRKAGEMGAERRAFGVDERSQFEAERRRESRWRR